MVSKKYLRHGIDFRDEQIRQLTFERDAAKRDAEGA